MSKTYYQLLITHTGKSIGSKNDDFETFDNTTKEFRSKIEALKYLSKTYNKFKKLRVYIDSGSGKSIQIGWIYCFKNSDISHNSKKWTQQDWIELRKITSKLVCFSISFVVFAIILCYTVNRLFDL